MRVSSAKYIEAMCAAIATLVGCSQQCGDGRIAKLGWLLCYDEGVIIGHVIVITEY